MNLYGQTSHQQERNNYVFVNENSSQNPTKVSQKVLINPHFKKSKVFVNPNFSNPNGSSSLCKNGVIHINPNVNNVNISFLQNCQFTQTVSDQISSTSVDSSYLSQNTTIHINPIMKHVKIPFNTPKSTPQNVHVNPNFKHLISESSLSNQTILGFKENIPTNSISQPLNKTVYLSRTKLVRVPSKIVNKTPIRRNSVKSKFKIVKGCCKSTPRKTRDVFLPNRVERNVFKIDHRQRTSLSVINKNKKKYVYVNRFLSVSDLAKNAIIKKSMSLLNISGVMYKKSVNSLRRASMTKPQNKSSSKSKYTFVKKPVQSKEGPKKDNKNRNIGGAVISKRFSIVRKRHSNINKVVKEASKKLRKCNIPCPYFRKYGMCKGKDNGKCFRKHDPDQIALCTKFLQGACLKENCPLSHNVSSKKMPTCKFYLEGSCSKENCPYLHVKLNRNAEVCRDFLEGFCKKAAECDKRHQYLCPEYEKHGKCSKQRCRYPHGNMVRHYLTNKTNFAKNHSYKTVEIVNETKDGDEKTKNKTDEVKDRARYYKEENEVDNNDNASQDGADIKYNLITRPKLGNLPAFIPFGET